MALSVALPLSGLETESFSTFNLFGLKSILTIPQGSPSPTASSESSGLGSLGSLPPSPHENEKNPFPEKKSPTPTKEVRIMYGGRDILDLRANIDPAGWKFQPTFLPKNNTSFFFANRSQYHRLSDYPEVDEFETESCNACGFTFIKQ